MTIDHVSMMYYLWDFIQSCDVCNCSIDFWINGWVVMFIERKFWIVIVTIGWQPTNTIHRHKKQQKKQRLDTTHRWMFFFEIAQKVECILNEMSSPDISMFWVAFLIVRKFYKKCYIIGQIRSHNEILYVFWLRSIQKT